MSDKKIERDVKVEKQSSTLDAASFNFPNTYNELCAEYYDMGQLPAEGALNFYLQYAQQAKGRILEPMCGTGLFLIPIKEAGCDIEGLDASLFMINSLKKKCIERGLSIPLVNQGLLQDLNQNQSYHLVVIPTGSINLMSEDLFETCLYKIYNSLMKDGLFVFEVCTPDWEKSIDINRYYVEVYPKPENKKLIASFAYSKPSDEIVEIVCRYELIQHNKLIKTELEVETLRLYKEEEIISLLKKVGFSNIKKMKRYEKNKAPDKGDKIIIFECKKN